MGLAAIVLWMTVLLFVFPFAYVAVRYFRSRSEHHKQLDEIRRKLDEKQASRPGVESYPDVLDASLVGTYPALSKAGGGYVWDEVLEYRVWCCPSNGAEDLKDGGDYYHAFASYTEALEFSNRTAGADEPLALVLQREFIDEPEPENYIHRKEERITEWPVTFLSRPRRNDRTIPDFLSPEAPPNRLDILRGLA